MPPLSRRTPGVLSNSGSPTTQLAEIREQLANEAANHVLPDDLAPVVRAHLDAHPSLAWDEALAEAIDQGMR